MFEVLVFAGVAYIVVVVAVCARIGRALAGTWGLALGLLLGPLGLLICVLMHLSDQLGAELGRLEESIDRLDHAMSTLVPWGRARPPRRPPA